MKSRHFAPLLKGSIEDLARDKGRRLVARVASGAWDAVIVSRSAFEWIALSPAAQQA